MATASDNPTPGDPIELTDADIGAPSEEVFIEKLTWRVRQHDFWVIGGLHDAGKSPLLATAAGVQQPLQGRHRLFGRDTAETHPEDMLAERLRIGLLFDSGRLLKSLTVAENVALPLQYHKDMTLEEASETVASVLELVEISHLAEHYPGQVGRSWQMRAALARALVLRPEVLLCDNPGAGLDLRHSRWWVDFLASLHAGHPWLPHRLTLVVTTDNLRPWVERGRQFALLKKKCWLPLGGPAELKASDEPLLQDLLAAGAG